MNSHTDSKIVPIIESQKSINDNIISSGFQTISRSSAPSSRHIFTNDRQKSENIQSDTTTSTNKQQQTFLLPIRAPSLLLPGMKRDKSKDTDAANLNQQQQQDQVAGDPNTAENKLQRLIEYGHHSCRTDRDLVLPYPGKWDNGLFYSMVEYDNLMKRREIEQQQMKQDELNQFTKQAAITASSLHNSSNNPSSSSDHKTIDANKAMKSPLKSFTIFGSPSQANSSSNPLPSQTTASSSSIGMASTNSSSYGNSLNRSGIVSVNGIGFASLNNDSKMMITKSSPDSLNADVIGAIAVDDGNSHQPMSSEPLERHDSDDSIVSVRRFSTLPNPFAVIDIDSHDKTVISDGIAYDVRSSRDIPTYPSIYPNGIANDSNQTDNPMTTSSDKSSSDKQSKSFKGNNVVSAAANIIADMVGWSGMSFKSKIAQDTIEPSKEATTVSKRIASSDAVKGPSVLSINPNANANAVMSFSKSSNNSSRISTTNTRSKQVGTITDCAVVTDKETETDLSGDGMSLSNSLTHDGLGVLGTRRGTAGSVHNTATTIIVPSDGSLREHPSSNINSPKNLTISSSSSSSSSSSGQDRSPMVLSQDIRSTISSKQPGYIAKRASSKGIIADSKSNIAISVTSQMMSGDDDKMMPSGYPPMSIPSFRSDNRVSQQ